MYGNIQPIQGPQFGAFSHYGAPMGIPEQPLVFGGHAYPPQVSHEFLPAAGGVAPPLSHIAPQPYIPAQQYIMPQAAPTTVTAAVPNVVAPAAGSTMGSPVVTTPVTTAVTNAVPMAAASVPAPMPMAQPLQASAFGQFQHSIQPQFQHSIQPQFQHSIQPQFQHSIQPQFPAQYPAPTARYNVPYQSSAHLPSVSYSAAPIGHNISNALPASYISQQPQPVTYSSYPGTSAYLSQPYTSAAPVSYTTGQPYMQMGGDPLILSRKGYGQLTQH